MKLRFCPHGTQTIPDIGLVVQNASGEVQYPTKSIGPTRVFFFNTRFGLLFQPTTMNQRKALAPIEINRSYGQELSPFQCGQISAYKAVGLSNSKIGEKLACGKSTVFNTLVQNPLRNEGKSLSRTGRPSALNCVQK